MAVVAVRVVADHDRGTRAPRSPPAGRSPRRGPRSRTLGTCVRLGAHHPGVAVAQQVQLQRARPSPRSASSAHCSSACGSRAGGAWPRRVPASGRGSRPRRPVQVTRSTRRPSATDRAIRPPVPNASSSGCAEPAAGPMRQLPWTAPGGPRCSWLRAWVGHSPASCSAAWRRGSRWPRPGQPARSGAPSSVEPRPDQQVGWLGHDRIGPATGEARSSGGERCRRRASAARRRAAGLRPGGRP